MTRPIAAARLVAAGAVAVVALAGCGDSPVRAGAAAVIGGDRISTEQLASSVDAGLADPAAAQLGQDRPTYQRDVLSRLISTRVVDVAAQRQGVSVTPAEVDAQYRSIESSVGGPEQLAQQAAAAGLTLDRVRELARTRALTAALGDALTADVVVPEAQLRSAYDAGIDQYDQVRTAQVQVATLPDAQALLPRARTLSNEAFAELARSQSLDESTKASGGDLGVQPQSAFASQGLAAYGAAAFAARVGDTFAVASDRGAHVVRVLERRTTTFEQARPELRRAALQEQNAAAVQDLLTRTADSLHITINPRFGSWDTGTLAVVARTEDGDHQVSSPEAPADGTTEPAPDPGGEAPSDTPTEVPLLPSPEPGQ